MKIKVPLFVLSLLVLGTVVALSQEIPLPRINIGVEKATKPEDVALSLQILFLLTILTLAPAILIMTTSFVRLVVVFSFLRFALGTQNTPPNQVLIGLSLFLTLFIMMPVLSEMHQKAWIPYQEGKIISSEAYQRGVQPLRKFMFGQTREKDIALFLHLTKTPRPKTQKDVPTYILMPAFMISELKTAFTIGFVIFVPFLIIDMVTASTLMSMGMLMVPPIMISLPFKILLFVMVDGWHLLIRSLVMSFK